MTRTIELMACLAIVSCQVDIVPTVNYPRCDDVCVESRGPFVCPQDDELLYICECTLWNGNTTHCYLDTTEDDDG